MAAIQKYVKPLLILFFPIISARAKVVTLVSASFALFFAFVFLSFTQFYAHSCVTLPLKMGLV